MLKKIFLDKYLYIVTAIAITFIIIKIPHLSVPYYWDEAFGFSISIRYMYTHGLSLLPSAIISDLSFGHPLLFHFLEAAWMKIFGTSQLSAKSFPLLISVLTLFSIYFFCKKFFNRITGVVAVLIFASQEIFIAQASFIQLEVLLTFLTITTLYFYFSLPFIETKDYRLKTKDYLYILSGLLLSFTKETGMILIILLSIWHFFEFIFSKRKNKFRILFKELLIIISPLILVSGYYIAQKLTYGWYFYPYHIEHISLKFVVFWDNLTHYCANNIFLRYNRYIMTIFFLLSLIFFIIKKYRPEKLQLRIILLFSLFIIVFLVFSSVNLMSSRYTLCLYPVYIILCSYFILSALRQYRLIAIAVIIIIITTKLYSTYTDRSDADSNLGFADAVLVHKKMVSYLEQNHFQDKIIYTHFLMGVDLTDPIPGYLSDKNNPFKHVSGNDKNINEAEYFIFSSTEYDPKYDNFKKQLHLRLIKRFEKYNSWSELYMANKY